MFIFSVLNHAEVVPCVNLFAALTTSDTKTKQCAIQIWGHWSKNNVIIILVLNGRLEFGVQLVIWIANNNDKSDVWIILVSISDKHKSWHLEKNNGISKNIKCYWTFQILQFTTLCVIVWRNQRLLSDVSYLIVQMQKYQEHISKTIRDIDGK